MTYCSAIRLQREVVFGSDSRSNAGVDYITQFSKMHTFQPREDRLFVVLCAGNLATTQEVFNHIQRGLDHPDEGESLASVRYLFEAAEYVGRVTVGPPFEIAIYARDALTLRQRMRFDQNSANLHALRNAWNRGLQSTLDALPLFEWESDDSASEPGS